MEKKSSVGILVIVSIILFIITTCSAEIYIQKDGLFKINVPDGWRCEENPQGIIIKSPEGNRFISILFGPASVKSDEEAKEELKRGNEMVLKAFEMREHLESKVVSDRETRIDGVYARQLELVYTTEGGRAQATNITFFNKGYGFTINFVIPLGEERLKMEEIVKSFQFQ